MNTDLELTRKLATHTPRELAINGFTRSAVLLTVLRGRDEDQLLFTRRTTTVEHHKGQISFPGGRLDEGETLQECALRETNEEVGIDPRDIRLVGRLDDTWTPTRYVMTPFVGLAPYPYSFTVNPGEIDEILVFPLRRLMHPDCYEENEMSYLGRTAMVPFFHLGETIIWGATARILKQFLRLAFDWEAQPCDAR